MSESEVREFIGHLVLQLRVAEMELERRAARITQLEGLVSRENSSELAVARHPA